MVKWQVHIGDKGLKMVLKLAESCEKVKKIICIAFADFFTTFPQLEDESTPKMPLTFKLPNLSGKLLRTMGRVYDINKNSYNVIQTNSSLLPMSIPFFLAYWDYVKSVTVSHSEMTSSSRYIETFYFSSHIIGGGISL